MWHWRGEQNAALLLAVLQMLAGWTKADGDVWQLRRWLGVDPAAGPGDIIDELAAVIGAVLEVQPVDCADAAGARAAWRWLVGTAGGPLPRDRRLHLVAAIRHAQWLLDAELVQERGGLPAHTAVRITDGPAVGETGIVYATYWLNDGGPPVGYSVWLDDGQTRIDTSAGSLRPVEESRCDDGDQPASPRPAVPAWGVRMTDWALCLLGRWLRATARAPLAPVEVIR